MNLIVWIKDNGMTIREFCNKANCSVGPINNIKHGVAISISIAYRIEKLTGVPMNDMGIKIAGPSRKSREVKKNLEDIETHNRITDYMDKVTHSQEIGCRALWKAIRNVKLRS